ncbi:MAG TPA: 3-dehydroquinate synthase [Thermomicrobiales bacterium]|nr:3-dehydroquinate synthase [Thermomicrobiales bacterium]
MVSTPPGETAGPLVIRAAGGESAIAVEPGGLAALGERVARQWPTTGRVFVVADEGAWAHHGDACAAALARADREARCRTVPAGEASKSLAHAADLYAWLAGERAERGEPVLAFGGGVAGDLAGFVAATYLRGVPLAQVPTTLLAMVDSSVGGKTGVNLPAGKNLVGAFYQPALVLADPRLLATLPARELRSGWAEVVKYAFLDRAVPGYDAPPLLPILREHAAALQALREPVTSTVIRACIAIKAAVVGQDERETGLRRILNLGHTVGHAVEAAAGYGRYTHGEAVALGLRAAARLAARRGHCDAALVAQVDGLLDAFGLPATIAGCPADALLARMGSDKKVRGGRVTWVLPTGAGTLRFDNAVPEADVRAVLAELGAA